MQPLPIFSHMPLHIKQEISGSLDCETQLSLRQCSKQCRDAVDRSTTNHVFFNVEIYSDKSQIEYGNVTDAARRRILKTTYQSHPDGYELITEDHRQGWNRVVKGKGNWIDRTARFFEAIFKCPKKSVRQFWLIFTPSLNTEAGKLIKSEFLCKMGQSVGRTQQLLCVKRLTLFMGANQDILPCFQMFRPGFLEYIAFYAAANTTLDEITEAEQWKQAKTFHNSGFQLALPYKKWAHLRLFFAKIKSMSMETLMLILQKFQQTPEWASYDLVLHERNTQIERYFKTFPLIRQRNCFGNKLRLIEVPNCETFHVGVHNSRDTIDLRKLMIN